MHAAASDPPELPGVLGLHHVAIAVASIDDALPLWRSAFGGAIELRAEVPAFGVDAICLEWPAAGGSTVLELIAPLTPEAGVAKFLATNGPGLHHIAWAVEDTAAALAAAVDGGMRALDPEPRPGLHGTPVAFLHPGSTGGTLIELVEVPRT